MDQKHQNPQPDQKQFTKELHEIRHQLAAEKQLNQDLQQEIEKLKTQDAADYRKAEESSRVKELFRRASKAAMIGAFSRDLRTGINYWSPEFLAIYGLGPNDPLPMKDGIPAAIHPDDRPFVLATGHHLYRSLFGSKHRIIRPDGEIRWVLVRRKLEFDAQNNPIRSHGIVMDITERKLAEKEIEDIEKRTIKLLESIGEAFVALDREAHVTYVNEKGVALSGMRREEMIGKCIWDLFPHAMNTNFDSEYHRAVETNSSVHFEEFYPEPLNIWVECHVYPSADGMSVFFRNITARKKIEEKLQQTRDTLQAIIDAAPAGIVVTEANGRILLSSAAAQTILGGPIPDDLTEPAFGYSFSMPDGSPMPSQDLPLSLALTGQTIAEQELLVTRSDGSQINILAGATPLKSTEGEIWGAVKVFQDITHRKSFEMALRQSEERYRRVVETASEGICQIDLDFRVADINQRMADMLGYSREEIIGQKAHKFLVPDEVASAEQKADQRRQGITEKFERRLIKKDGSILWALVSATPVFDHEDKIAGSFSMFMNITERKEAEFSLLQLNEELEQRVAERTQLAEYRTKQLQALAVELIEAEENERRKFAHLLHDDLQQMLAAAKMQLHAFSEKWLDEPTLADVEEIIKDAIEKARHLSHELSPPILHHSGLSAGLRWLARRAGEQFELQVDFVSNLEQRHEFVPIKTFLFRAVQELLFNVVKHSGVKNARVVLSGSESDLTITVSDLGKGFDPDIEKSGAGFGLMSIRERVTYMGGSLTIHSVPEKGSRLVISVPLKILNAKENLPPPQVVVEKTTLFQAPSDPTSGDTRVLFVDDHHVMRQGLIKLVIGQPGIQVVGEAANGLEAVAIARSVMPDVVIMDVSMPGMDGIQATRRIKAEMPDVRVIGLSMYEDEHIIRAMREAGAEEFISKSVSPADLLKVIYKIAPDNKP